LSNFKDKQELIEQKINQTLVGKSCPMCKGQSFDLVDGYINNLVQDDLNIFNIGGRSVPTVMIICKSCGYVIQFALGNLGLLNEDKKDG